MYRSSFLIFFTYISLISVAQCFVAYSRIASSYSNFESKHFIKAVSESIDGNNEKSRRSDNEGNSKLKSLFRKKFDSKEIIQFSSVDEQIEDSNEKTNRVEKRISHTYQRGDKIEIEV